MKREMRIQITGDGCGQRSPKRIIRFTTEAEE